MSKLNKRILSALLALVLFLTNFPVITLASDTFEITYEGERVSHVEFYQHQKITVTAENIPEGSCQWQIKIPGTKQWVNIQGQTDAELGLSYAVVGSLLADDSAYVRCAVISGGTEVAHTAALRATVKEEEPVQQTPVVVPSATEAPAEATEAPVEATEAPVEETEAPVEETEAPVKATEAPVEETEAPVEATEAPVEETEAPVEATEVPVEETEAPVEATEAPVEATEAPVEATEVPVEETETPVEATEAPVEETEAPVEATEAPVEATEALVEETEAPVEATEAPVEATEAPVEPTEAPAEETEEATEASAEETEEATEAPVEETEAPKKTSKKSSKKSSKKTTTQAVTDQKTESVTPKAAGDTNAQIVTVTVHYRAVNRDNNFETTGESADSEENAANAQPVTDSYVANIVSGSALNVTIPCHVIPGYTLTVPSYHTSGIAVVDNNLVLSLSNVTADMTFYAYYRESQVSYTARYFMQNVYNDLYTERMDILTGDIQNSMVGYPGEEPNPLIIYPDVTGFTALFFQPDTIAADGSTVFEVYYDRNYYLMNFNMDGGFGTAPVYARYESAFTFADPTKSGYVFDDEWELQTVNGVAATPEQKTELFPTTIPAENRTYKAAWTKASTSYTVAYWLENANTTGYSFYASKTVGLDSNGNLDGSVKSDDRVSADEYATDTDIFGVDKSFISYDEEKTLEEEKKRDDLDSDDKVIVQGDGSTVINVYFKRKVYNLKFYYAMETTNDQNANTAGHQHIYVIGGSTYYFGNNASSDKGDDVKLLSYYMGNGSKHRGTITALPELTDAAKNKGYIRDYEEATVYSIAYKYHYLQFSAKYGQDIGNMWPIDVFKPVERADTSADPNNWSGKLAYASAWNGEHHVWYSKNKPDNQTIKGKYQKLDYRILWDSSYGEPSDGTVSYLCFWENGTEASDLTWSVPDLFYYRLWLPVIGDVPEGAITTTKNKKIDGTDKEITYILKEHYATCDNSTPGEQTLVSIDGYGDDVKDQGESDAEVSYRESYSGDIAKEILKNNYNYTDAIFDTYRHEYVIDFFYGRTNYRIKYHNATGYLGTGEGALVPYGKSLVLYGDQGDYASKEKMESDHYPKGYEPDAYTFEGWYISENFLPGTEMDWTGTMPARNVEVYANWQPIKYTTYFYMDYARYDTKKYYDKIEGTPHGENMILGVFDPNPTFVDEDGNTNTDYRFVGWFYIDGDGTKKAFNPSEMAVRRELHLFAEWTTTTVREYTVSYQYGEEISTGVYGPANPSFTMAKDSEGYALEATTKTFKALPKDKLTSFPDGKKDQLWLPHTNSHSIVIRPDNNENVFTFYYVTKDVAPYTVRYLDATTHEPIKLNSDGTEYMGGDPNNTKAVVTETFQYIKGYIPDAFHKQLILSANDEENVIIFYYTKDDDVDIGGGDVGGGDDPDEGRARYLVVHHFPELDGSDYTVEEDKIGNIGEPGTGTEQERPGFEFDEAKTKEKYEKQFVDTSAATYVKQEDGKWTVSGTVTSGKDTDANKPLELHLYYKRLNYGYKVQYIDRETKDPIPGYSVVVRGAVPFESVVSETSPEIPGYDIYGPDDGTDGKTKTLTLKISWEEDLNVITFEYIKKKVTINYIPICTDTKLTSGFGGVSNPLDYDKTTPTGSEAYAASGFHFLGWYTDKNPVEANLVTKKAQLEATDFETSNDVFDYTFYAIFKPITLTIHQTGMRDGKNESGVYEVVNAGGNVVATVIITGNNSVTIEQIPAGTYTVRELNGDWTWTYDHDGDNPTVEVKGDQENVVTFTQAAKTVDWLHDENT